MGNAYGIDATSTVKMDVLLIYPPYERLMGLKVEYFPISLGCIATILNENGYNVAIYNAECGTKSKEKYSPHGRANVFIKYKKEVHAEDHEIWNEIKDVIKEKKPRIVGITSYAPTHSAVLRIAKIAKEIYNCCVVIGGPYPTLLPEEACQNRYVDYVVSGEGEYIMLELTNYLLKNQGALREIRGITFKIDGKCISTPKRERISDLDSLPFADYDLLLYKDSYEVFSHLSIIASRGCPHRCAFCANVPIWGRKVVYRSTDSILNEIERNYKKSGTKSFRFLDDNFLSNVGRAVEFCEKFVERGLQKKLSWGCLSRVDTVSEKLIRSLETANCRSIALGVESGSDHILKTLKKDITKDLVRKKVKMIKKSKLMMHLYFMIGSPYEKEEDIIETYDFIKELNPDSMNLCTFTPYYGTELYNTCVSKGILPDKHDVLMYEKIGHHNKYNYFCHDIPVKRYIELVEMMMDLSDEICERVNRKKIIAQLKYYFNHPTAGIKKIRQKLINIAKV